MASLKKKETVSHLAICSQNSLSINNMTKPINALSITDKKRIKKAAAFVYTVKTKLTTLQQLLLEMTNDESP